MEYFLGSLGPSVGTDSRLPGSTQLPGVRCSPSISAKPKCYAMIGDVGMLMLDSVHTQMLLPLHCCYNLKATCYWWCEDNY